MNKLLLVAAAGLSIAALSSPASAADGSITISGTIQSSSCTVNSGAVVVDLPPVSTSAFSGAGTVAGKKAFSISLTNCTAGAVATAYFDLNANIDSSGRLKNNGLATNVQVQLLNSTNGVMNLAAGSLAQNGSTTTLVTGDNKLDYFAQYYATGTVGAGSVNTSAVYTMQYN